MTNFASASTAGKGQEQEQEQEAGAGTGAGAGAELFVSDHLTVKICHLSERRFNDRP